MGSPAFGCGAIFYYVTFHRGARVIHFLSISLSCSAARAVCDRENDEVGLTGYPPGYALSAAIFTLCVLGALCGKSCLPSESLSITYISAISMLQRTEDDHIQCFN